MFLKRLLLLTFMSAFGILNAQNTGCTDSLALNFNPYATINDGSCIYPTSYLTSTNPIVLADSFIETSGLAIVNHYVLSINDSGTGPFIYFIDTTNGTMLHQIKVINAQNIDWEAMASDDTYVYIGDIGNNLGNRTDLTIYRIEKSLLTLQNNTVIADTITFDYQNQNTFTSDPNTNFDCEAMLAYNDSLYLFTKNHGNNKTHLYVLPNSPGHYSAVLIDSFDTEGLITGATINSNQTILLCGYTATLDKDFIWKLWDNNSFFTGNKRQFLTVQNAFSTTQTEAIVFLNDCLFYTTNEGLPSYNIQPVLQQFSICDDSTLFSGLDANISQDFIITYSNNTLKIDCLNSTQIFSVQLFDVLGRQFYSHQMNADYSNPIVLPVRTKNKVFFAKIITQTDSFTSRVRAW